MGMPVVYPYSSCGAGRGSYDRQIEFVRNDHGWEVYNAYYHPHNELNATARINRIALANISVEAASTTDKYLAMQFQRETGSDLVRREATPLANMSILQQDGVIRSIKSMGGRKLEIMNAGDQDRMRINIFDPR